MRIISLLARFLIVALLAAGPAAAQDEDEGFLTRKLQELLSGAGRTVDIVGFQGALSSQASFARMTIADDEGIWLTLEDVVLEWSRSALLAGRLEVKRLSAARVDLPRLPESQGSEMPKAEATPFSLPELPVSVNIELFEIQQINIGAPLFGEEAQLALTASARLNDDGLFADLNASRTDGKEGQFDIKATLNRSDNALDLLLKLEEGEDGIAARLLNIPDRPSVRLEVAGNGPLDDFTADVLLATAGEERLAGQVKLNAEASAAGGETPDRRVTAEIDGDITALVLPQYREFFGPDVGLQLDALLRGDGGVDVRRFALNAASAQLEGTVILGTDKWPQLVDIKGTVARADGERVLLPVGGGDTYVDRVVLDIGFDAAAGDTYEAVFDVNGLQTSGAIIEQTRLSSRGTVQTRPGAPRALDGAVDFAMTGLAMDSVATDEALGREISGSAELDYVEGQPFRISDLTLAGTDYGLAGDLEIGVGEGLQTRIDAVLNTDDLSRFSALAGRELAGRADVSVDGTLTPLSGAFDLAIAGTATDIVTGIAQADAVLDGQTELSLTARRDETGTFVRDLSLENPALDFQGEAVLANENSRVTGEATLRDIGLVLPQYSGPVTVSGSALQDQRGWTVDVQSDGPYGARASAQGLATGPDAAIAFEVSVPELNRFQPQVNGPLDASGLLRQTPQGWSLRTTASGPYGAEATIDGIITGPDLAVDFDLAVPNVQPLVPSVSGPLNATGRVYQTPQGIAVDATARGLYGARATVDGIITGPDMAVDFDLAVPNVQPLVPSVSGPLNATGRVYQTPQGIVVDATARGPYNSSLNVQGTVTGDNPAVDFDVSLPNVNALVPKISGPLNVTGSARQTARGWLIDTRASVVSGTRAEIAGLIADGGMLDLTAQGSLPLGLAGPFIAPRALQGSAQFDLVVQGPPALNSVSGTIRVDDATLSAPNLRFALEGVDATVRLASGRANLEISGAAGQGGRVSVDGSIGLDNGFPADLDVTLSNVVISDPRLYRTSVSGALDVDGRLTGGARISGAINLGDTFVTVPSTGLTSIGNIPPIDHVDAPQDVTATRRRAGLIDGDAATDPAGQGRSGPGFALDIQVNAPDRIFVRGRGLDAELGGSLALTGTTKRMVSSGRFELVRGRLDILGKRFDLVEGSIQFQGDLIPYIRFVTSTTTQTGEVRIIVQGPAVEPEVIFEATPDAPQDEVLAQLLFGRNLSEISAFQALQLANAVATLAGRGGGGIIDNLRDNFGLDDLDVTTTDEGETALRVGKYLSDNIYTDVTAASDGTGEVSLNLDLTDNLKAKGTLGSDGNSRLGIFFEKDY